MGPVLGGRYQPQNQSWHEYGPRRGVRILPQPDFQRKRFLLERGRESKTALGPKPIRDERRGALESFSPDSPPQDILVSQLGRIPAANRSTVHHDGTRREGSRR